MGTYWELKVNVTVFDQLPQPQDDKVKVNLISPNVKEDKTAIINEFNNLRWTFTIPSGGSHTIPYQYTVEWPKANEIIYTQ